MTQTATETETPELDQQLDIEAEILREIWHEGKATPLRLSSSLNYDKTVVYDCIGDLIQRGCIFQFWLSPQGGDLSVYCLTKRVQRKIHKLLQAQSRYKLRSFWLSFNREDLIWLSCSFQN